MNTVGNLYLCETKTGKITLLAPTGKKATLTFDPGFVRPDSAFISADRHLYVPRKPGEPGGNSDAPVAIYSLSLPERFADVRLGAAITGAS